MVDAAAAVGAEDKAYPCSQAALCSRHRCMHTDHHNRNCRRTNTHHHRL